MRAGLRWYVNVAFTIFRSDAIPGDRARLEVKIQLSGSTFCQDIVYRSFDGAVEQKCDSIRDSGSESIVDVVPALVASDEVAPSGAVPRFNFNFSPANWPPVCILHRAFNSRTGGKQVACQNESA